MSGVNVLTLFTHTHTMHVHVLPFEADKLLCLFGFCTNQQVLNQEQERVNVSARHTDTQTHRHTDTQTHRHTDTQTRRHRHKDTDTDTRPSASSAPLLVAAAPQHAALQTVRCPATNSVKHSSPRSFTKKRKSGAATPTHTSPRHSCLACCLVVLVNEWPVTFLFGYVPC